jgi:hypothetical protein
VTDGVGATRPGGDEPLEEESFGRPFLGFAMPGAAAPGIPAQPGSREPAPAEEGVDEAFRPYLLTGGRTGGGRAGIKIETLLVRDLNVPAGPHTTSPELARIADACDDPVAVAEVAVRVGLPVGVVQVLAGDLVSAGVLQRSSVTTSLADDVLFIERLIQGVASL